MWTIAIQWVRFFKGVFFFLSANKVKKKSDIKSKVGQLHIAFIGWVMMNLDAFLLKSHCVTKVCVCVCVYCTVYLPHTYAQGQLLVT